MAYKQLSPLPVEQGGTNTSSFPFDHGVLVFEAGQQISINPSVNGYVLTSNGPALPPTFQAIDAHGALVEMTADTGNAVPLVGVIDLAGGSNINTSATGNTVTVNLDNTVSVSGSITAGTGLVATLDGIQATGNSSIDGGADGKHVFIGTGAFSQAITIGNSTTSTVVEIDGGLSNDAGGIYIGYYADTPINIGNGNGEQSITIQAGGFGLNLGSSGGGTTISDTGGIFLSPGSAGINVDTFTSYGAVVTDNSGILYDATATAGYVLTGNSGSIPTFQALPSTPKYITWVDQITTPLIMAVNTGYVMDDGANLITAALPVTAAVGNTLTIQGFGSGLFTIAQNALQTIHFGAISTTTGTGGSLSSTGQYDSVTLVCVKTNTDFAVMASVGNLSWI